MTSRIDAPVALAPPCPDELTRFTTPRALAEYAQEALPLGADAPGKHGWLDLQFARVGGKTRLIHAFGRVPYAVPRALAADLAWPELAVVYLAMPTGGIAQGDRLALRIRVAGGSSVHVTTQAATKVYGMVRNCALSTNEIFVDDGAYLEYWPDPIIPQAGARYGQQTFLRVAPEARLIYREVISAGRVARGERFAYQIILLETTALGGDGEPRFVDALRLKPARAPLAGRGFFAGHDALGTLYLLGSNLVDAALVDALDAALRDDAAVFGGISSLPGRSGLVIRLLAPTTAHAMQAQERLRAVIRTHLDLPVAGPLRK